MTLLPSDPLYPAWDWLLTLRAAYVNAHVHYDLRNVADAERAAMLAELDAETRQAFEEMTR